MPNLLKYIDNSKDLDDHMDQKDQLIYRMLTQATRIAGNLSSGTAGLISKGLGIVWFLMDRKHRKIAFQNLNIAFGDEKTETEIEMLAKAAFSNTVRMFFEYAWYYTHQPIDYDAHFRMIGTEHLKNAIKKRKGVIVILAHLGNWELLTAFAPMTGLPATVVYRPIKSKAVNRFVIENRNRTGIEFFPLHGALDAVKEALAQGTIAGLLADQNSGHQRGVFVDFFGKKACTAKGPAKLAMGTGAPMIPIFLYREKTKFVLEIQPELPLVNTGNEQADIRHNTQVYTSAIETVVRRHPEQYFWLHRRWKTRPKAEHL